MTLHIESLTACPICSGNRLQRIQTAPDYESHTGEYGIDECADCGVAFTNPRPIEADLGLLYEKRDTADFPELNNFVQRLRDYAIDRYLRAQLDSSRNGIHAAEVHVLDFGCGDGALSRGVVRYGQRHSVDTRVTAVDFHSDAPVALANVAGSRYLSYEQWQSRSERYHAVFLRHVLEHHPQPLRLLAELTAVLLPGGRVFIEVPNRRSVWAKVFGGYYSAYYLPRHLMHFDHASLAALLGRAGFSAIEVRFGHTPLLGRSLGYRLGKDIGNTGLIGLATYPMQVMVDMLCGRSSTLRATAKIRG